jgi:hypothetical protein
MEDIYILHIEWCKSYMIFYFFIYVTLTVVVSSFLGVV